MGRVADLELGTTRNGLHAVAEQVLAAAQYRATGDIRLRAVPGGFGTTQLLAGDVTLSVIGDRIVVSGPSGQRSTRLTTVADAAAFVGIEAGLPDSAYPAATALRPDEPLHQDEAAARELADWYALADAALRRFAAESGAETDPVIWPEHFDIGIALGAVNYGASPGDDEVAEPYVYVGPHDGPPVRDGFWNASFGAARTRSEVSSVGDALVFFREGRARSVPAADAEFRAP